MAELHWFPFNARSWLGSAAVALMSPEQEGAFIHVLAAMWDDGTREPCLPDDNALLARVSRLGSRWEKIGGAIRAQFVVRNDRIYSPHLSELWQAQRARYERRAVAGRKGNEAKARHAKRDALPDAMPDASHHANGSAKRPAKRDALATHSAIESELELDREHSRGSKEPQGMHLLAPEARASADEARAAPSAEEREVHTPVADEASSDSASGSAVNGRRAGGGPVSVSAVMADLLPGRGRPRKSTLEQREKAEAKLRDEPEFAARIDEQIAHEFPRANAQQRHSMRVSAAVNAMTPDAAPGGA